MTIDYFITFILTDSIPYGEEESQRVQNHYIIIITQLWLTSNPRSTEVLLNTGTPGTSREIYSEDAHDGVELATPRL